MTDTALDAKEGFTFGCDPELFIVDKGGHPVPAAGLIPGTKEEPFKVEFGAVQVDGMAAEFNIDPAANFTDFNRNIKSVMTQLTKMLPTGLELSAVPFVRFQPHVFDAAPDDAKALGCMPDFNAWTGEVNTPPENLADPYMRCAAGHLHLGWTDPDEANLADTQHIMNCRDLTKQLDWYLGGWSVRMDADPTRRSLYGKAGACRYKPYGVEYRVLSNFWISTRDRRLAVWNRMQQAIEDMRKRYVPDRVGSNDNAQLIQAINSTMRDAYLEKYHRYPITTIDRGYS